MVSLLWRQSQTGFPPTHLCNIVLSFVRIVKLMKYLCIYEEICFMATFRLKFLQVSCGGKHTLLLTEELEVLSFGVGEFGHLGTGSTVDSLVPAPLVSLESMDVVQVAAGYDHSLVLTSDGRVFSWGRNNMVYTIDQSASTTSFQESYVCYLIVGAVGY